MRSVVRVHFGPPPLSGGIAQLGERLPCKQEVSGSIPLISTKEEERLKHFSKEEGFNGFSSGDPNCTLKTEHCRENDANYEKATVRKTFYNG